MMRARVCKRTMFWHGQVVTCANCNGAGDVKRMLGFLLGNQTCPTCQGQGYFPMSPAAPTPEPKQVKKGKRIRESDDEASEDSDEQRKDGRGEGVGGGSEPRRHVSRLNRLSPSHRSRK